MSGTKNRDLWVKVVTVLLSFVVVPTFAWVWKTNLTQAKLEFRVQHLEQKIKDYDSLEGTVNQLSEQNAVMSNDMVYLREAFDDIKSRL
jgi:biopolymer transport protein ExbB/TolQ